MNQELKTFADVRPGQAMICHRPCGTCPFGGGPKAVKLKAARIREIAAAGQFYCHTAVHDKQQKVICRGWDAQFNPNFTRVMERIGGLVEVNVYELPQGTYETEESDEF